MLWITYIQNQLNHIAYNLYKHCSTGQYYFQLPNSKKYLSGYSYREIANQIRKTSNLKREYALLLPLLLCYKKNLKIHINGLLDGIINRWNAQELNALNTYSRTHCAAQHYDQLSLWKILYTHACPPVQVYPQVPFIPQHTAPLRPHFIPPFIPQVMYPMIPNTYCINNNVYPVLPNTQIRIPNPASMHISIYLCILYLNSI